MRFSPFRAALLGVAVVVLAAGSAGAELPDALPRVTFRFERPGVVVPEYKLSVGRDGSAVYEGQETGSIRGGVDRDAAPAAARPFHAEVTLSRGITDKIFEMATALNEFRTNCSTKAKNVADTGAKTLKYKGPEGESECTFNYSDNKVVMQLSDLFQGIAETMDEGRVLDQLHRFDRLGLDAAIGRLAEEVASGRALELNTIAPTLRSIAADTEVMERVRIKASRLLSTVPADMRSGGQ